MYEILAGKILGIGKEMLSLMEELFPICRSITGNGVRKSLDIIKKHIDIQIFEVPTGTRVFDWTIPKEWNITDAYVIDPNGNKIIDFKRSNLHILNYSIPVKKTIPLKELKNHLYSIPEQPDLIPYRTSYYKEEWGFCLPHKQLSELKDGNYQVFIDSKLENGSLTYGEYFVKGKTNEEVIFSCYICHPSMCNDNLSGVVMTTYLAKIISTQNTKYSYRFLFIPETIGSITWLSRNEKNLDKIKHGLVITCVGDRGKSTYKKSRYGKSKIDKIVQNVLENSGTEYSVLDFFPTGSDERQFCSPGFDLPMGSLMRTRYGKFAEYHTSADNLSFVDAESLDDTFSKYISTVYVLENDKIFENLNQKCEPHLGKRGLYDLLGGQKDRSEETAISWILNLSDGENSLLDISIKSNTPFPIIKHVSDLLVSKNLLREIKQ